MVRVLWLVGGVALCACAGCAAEDDQQAKPLSLVAVTFNTGTNDGLPHDAIPDDGYGSAEAALSDQYYGDGLAWSAVIEDARRFFEQTPSDVIGFQEIFHSAECATIPSEARPGFVCESWQPGDPTVAQWVVGAGFQVACQLAKPDKCLAVRRSFGNFAGCAGELCLDGLDGAAVAGCGSGSRIGRGVIELAAGGTLTVVNVHGTSGIEADDRDCRVRQFTQVFVDLGDGEPAANGQRNLILGDLNTDPGRNADFDQSSAFFNEHVGDGKRFHFVSEVGPQATPTYAGFFNIDHVISDALDGSCWTAGIGGHPAVSGTVFFDHKPLVCTLRER
jgi:hypothetical protein